MALSATLNNSFPWNKSAGLQDMDLFPNMSNIFPSMVPFEVPYIRWLFITLFVIIFLCCVIGNASVIYVILRHHKMRNVTNFFLANLAASDLCVGLFCVLPNLSTFLSPYWQLGRVMCKFYYFIQCASYTASVLILTIISLERYFAIIHPMLNKRVSRMCLLRVVVVIIWLCAAVYGVPNLIAYDIYQVEGMNATMQFCVTTGDWKINMEIYSIINFIVLYALPLLLITVMYVRISNALWISGRNMGVTSSVRQVNRSTSQNSRSCVKKTTCPHCSCTCHRKDANAPLISGHDEDGQSDNRSSPVSHEYNSKTAKMKPKRWLFKHVIGQSQWARSADDLSADVSHCHGNCQCAATNKLPTNKRVLFKSTSKSTVETKVYNPLRTRRKVIRLLICIIVSFAVCVLPHHIRLLWQYWSVSSNTFSFNHMLVPPTTFIFFYANSALNPFLYALLSDHFRRAFADLMPTCCRCRRNPKPYGFQSRDSRFHRQSDSEVTNVQLRHMTSNKGCANGGTSMTGI